MKLKNQEKLPKNTEVKFVLDFEKTYLNHLHFILINQKKRILFFISLTLDCKSLRIVLKSLLAFIFNMESKCFYNKKRAMN